MAVAEFQRSQEFERIRRLYNEGRINEVGLDRAVKLGLITETEKEIIMTENF